MRPLKVARIGITFAVSLYLLAMLMIGLGGDEPLIRGAGFAIGIASLVMGVPFAIAALAIPLVSFWQRKLNRAKDRG